MIDLQEVLRLHGLWLGGDPAGTRAVLTDAVLTDAVLTDAVLTDAVLRGAVLTDADLTGADLTGADLTRAVLTDAVLRGAVLRGAVLRGAVLTGADLTDAVLTDAVLTGAVLTDAVLTGAEDLRVPNLHTQILARIEAGGALEMASWHLNNASCGTQHCHAGWAIHLAGGAGAKLEAAIGPAAAGALIITASCPYLERVPNFYADNETALAEIRRCAEIEAAQAVPAPAAPAEAP